MNLLDAAVLYARRGWNVVPIPYKEKGPRIKGWQNLRLSEETLQYSPLASGQSNLGLILGECSKLVCVDLDCEEAKILAPLFLPKTSAIYGREGNESSHWFYRCEDAGETKKWNIPKHADVETHHSVELLSTGNQVVVGPSVHETGSLYNVIENEPDAVEWETIKKSCEALHKAVLAKLGVEEEQKREQKKADKPIVLSQKESDLRQALAEHGAEILGEGVTNDGCDGFYVTCPSIELHTTKNNPKDCMVWKGRQGGWQAKCFHASCGVVDWQSFKQALDPNWQHDKTQAISSVNLSGLLSVNQQQEDDEEQVDLSDYSDIESIESFPEECLFPPGLIGEIVKYNLATAKYPQPEHALAGALCIMSLITGRRVTDYMGTRTNLMVVALGPTRSGKEHPRQVNKRILELAGASPLYEEKLASHAALHGFLKQNNIGLLMNDEFGDFLALARSTRGGNTQPAQIVSAMLKLYSSAGSNYKADRYSDKEKQIEINQPHFVLYGTSTGEVFWKHTTPEYLSGGLFGRLMIFENRGYVDPVEVDQNKKAMPESIFRTVDEWLGSHKQFGLLWWENPDPYCVPYTPEAKERYQDHELEISKRRKNESAVRAALWSGTGEITSKLALLFSCSRCRESLQIQRQDVDLAVRLSNWLTRRKVSLAMLNVSENLVEGNLKRVFQIVISSGVDGMTKSELTRKTQWLNGRQRQEILSDLCDAKLIQIESIETNGRARLVVKSTINAMKLR